MKKILLVLLCAVSLASAADTLLYRKGATPTRWADATAWSPSFTPTTLNRIAIFDADSATAQVDTITASTTVGQMRFLNAYTGSNRLSGALIIQPSVSRQFIVNGADRTYFSAGSSALTVRATGNGIRCTLNVRGAYSGGTILASTGATTPSIYAQKVIVSGTVGTNHNAASTIAFRFLGDTVSGTTLSLGVNGASSTDSIFCTGLFKFQAINFSTYQTGTSYQYWQGAIFKCAGNLTRSINATTVIDVGTSKFIFDSTTNTVLANLSGTRRFYDIEIAKNGAAKCSTATATDTVNCNEMRVTSGKLNIIAPLYCNSYLNLSTDTSRMMADKYINTSFYRASTANALADTFKTYFVTNVNHDISCDTNITLGRFIVSAGRATALTNLRLIKFTLPVASKLTIANGKIFVVDSTYDIEGTSGNLDSVVSATGATLKLPAADTVQYVYFKNITSVNPIYAPVANGNVDGGGNVNINFGIDTVPSITSITPDHGTFGTTVTVSGTTFGSAPSGYLNGGLVPYVSRDSISYVFNATDLGLFGIVPFVIKNNVYNTYDTINWSYDTIPALTSALPLFAKLTPAAHGTVTGVGMSLIDTVWYGTVKATIDSATYTTLYVTLPNQTVRGSKDIRTHARYGYRDTLVGAITYKNLHVTSLTPPRGKIGDTVTARAIWGLGTTGLSVTVNDSAATVIAGYVDTLARFIAPNNVNGNYSVRFINTTGDTTFNTWQYSTGGRSAVKLYYKIN